MSEGRARLFWKQNRAKIQIGMFVGAVALAIAIPFIQAPLCAVSQNNSQPASYQVTTERPYRPDGGSNGVNPSLSQFSFGPSVDAPIQEIERTESSYYAPQQEENWGRRYWCDIKAPDYFLVLFTLALAVSTFFLWRETERLAEGASDQSNKMRESLELAQREFVATHRPHIKVRYISNSLIRGEMPVTFRIVVANGGDTEAVITNFIVGVSDIREDGQWRVPLKPFPESVDIQLVSGEVHQFLCSAEEPSDSYLWSHFMAAESTLVVFGEITYLDKNSVKRRTGFAREWDHSLERYGLSKSHGDAEYED